jgi:tetratricopeptide (TPR) repeat protein
MSALPRPDIPPGARRELADALHDLHHRAGWPSLRRLASAAGCSHTTVSKVFSTTALPAWGTLELLVEAMDGDTADFHELWLAASDPTGGRPAPPETGIAGRRAELAAVRHHLERGSGLLLVAGEAGIGKTALVTAAARATDVRVATGHCRPLSTQVPLLPIGDLLREVLADSEWFSVALKSCPPYVAHALAPLLPELGLPSPAPPASEVARQQLFSAVPTFLAALAETRPVALLLEDLPWADSVTLDLVETMVARGVDLPLVATWRSDDPDTSAEHESWRARVARSADVVTLGPLSVEDTATQLELLTGHAPSAEETDRVFRRSRGHPLYTEQLATVTGEDEGVPAALADLLTRRLSVLDERSWRLARALGVADRPLTPEQLALVAGDSGDLVAPLRTLWSQRLLARDTGSAVLLRHPLIAAAIRLQLVPGEATEAHRSLAELLAGLPDPPASEIAGHWRAAGERAAELRWRIRAGEAADRRFAHSEGLAEWSRALELWDRTASGAHDDPFALARIHTKVIESAIWSGAEVSAVRRLVERAMVEEVPEQGRAEILLRAGDLECAHGDEETGLRLIREAVAINDRHPPTVEAGHVLEVSALTSASLGRFEEAMADTAKGMRVAEQVGDIALRRRMLAVAASMSATRGDHDDALRFASEARTALPAADDPGTAIRVAALETDVLLTTGAPAAAVEAAAQAALREADRWHMRGMSVDVTIANLAEAHLREGDVAAAERLVAPRVPGLSVLEQRYTQAQHAAVEMRRGRVVAAIERLEALSAVGNYSAGAAEVDLVLADALLWAGRPEEAIQRMNRAGTILLEPGYATAARRLLVGLARAEADLAATQAATEAAGEAAGDDRRQAAHQRLVRARRSAISDPLSEATSAPEVRGSELLWRAEVARLDHQDRLAHWVEAAKEWYRLHRPHDSAYCRWRAAQAALRDGQGTLAARLLTRAAADAREHQPLAQAIAGTVAEEQ